MKLETFDDVLASMKRSPNRKFHLLLGNGFSVGYDKKMFSYNALHDFLTGLTDPDLTTVLSVVETRNFELIMQYLDTCAVLIETFGGSAPLKKRIDTASRKLKTGLLDAVKELHPEHVFKVAEEQSAACARFLDRFLDTKGNIYSTNYDLLLYWVLMRHNTANHIDGCGRELENADDGEFVKEEDQEWSGLIWGKYRESQNVFYVHGALHLFDSGTTIVKEEYEAHNYLLTKISARMEKGEYPIFVTAGNGLQKLNHIMHNQYLTHCYESLCQASGSLVTFGFGFGSYDNHIIDAINRAANRPKGEDKLWSIYIGVFSDEDKRHIEQIYRRFKCKVHIYDAKTPTLWGK